MTLEEAAANVGKAVEYVPFGRAGTVVDRGVIAFVNDTFVFVKYALHHGSQATRPEDLRLAVTP
jgi:hypothetical protein